MKKRIMKLSALGVAFIMCLSMVSCAEKQKYDEFDEGTQEITFGDITMSIPQTWELDEEDSNENGRWYEKNVNKVTQSMLYLSKGTTREDFDSINKEDEFFDQYIKELGRSEGVKVISEPENMEINGNEMRYIYYDQDINHSTYEVQTYLILKGTDYYNISFGTFVDNKEDFEKSFETLKVK